MTDHTMDGASILLDDVHLFLMDRWCHHAVQDPLFKICSNTNFLYQHGSERETADGIGLPMGLVHSF